MKAKHKALYISLTIIFSILFCILKLFSFGWGTLIFIPVLAFYLACYIGCGSSFANSNFKTKDGYLLFWLASLSFIATALTFSDAADGPKVFTILNFIPVSTLQVLCIISTIINIFLEIMLIKSIKDSNKAQKSSKNTIMKNNIQALQNNSKQKIAVILWIVAMIAVCLNYYLMLPSRDALLLSTVSIIFGVALYQLLAKNSNSDKLAKRNHQLFLISSLVSFGCATAFIGKLLPGVLATRPNGPLDISFYYAYIPIIIVFLAGAVIFFIISLKSGKKSKH